jgi:hypothetical protein
MPQSDPLPRFFFQDIFFRTKAEPKMTDRPGHVHIEVDLTGTTNAVQRAARLAPAIDAGIKAMASDQNARLLMIVGEAYQR